jgi:1-deoxy-D-xylulose-5-phosphate reductoisomerase
MVRSISILGSTGSIGRQTVAVAEHLGLRVRAITTNRSIALAEEQARRLHPAMVAVTDEAAAKELRVALADTDIKVWGGEHALVEAAVISEADTVVTAVSGAVGLRPTLEAIRKEKRIALANKETLVCAGEIVMREAKKCGAEIVPVDSEHSAIFQCLTGREGELRKILLTGSGGPFRGWTREQTKLVTPEQAVRHPNWSMGAKISVDSATMMNKGLEFIEAMHLFSVTPDEIEVLIHPESVIHSMIELKDGAVLAQLGVPSMELPIAYALSWPERFADCAVPAPDFFALGALHFEKPDLAAFPCLALAMEAMRRGGSAPLVLNAANEALVQQFLEGRIRFGEIAAGVERALSAAPSEAPRDVADVLALDAETREQVLAC